MIDSLYVLDNRLMTTPYTNAAHVVDIKGPAILNQILRHSLVGKPNDVAQKVRKYIDTGIEQFFLAFQDPFDYEAIQLFMNTVEGLE